LSPHYILGLCFYLSTSSMCKPFVCWWYMQ